MKMSYSDIMKAFKRIKPFLHVTPVFTSHTVDQRVGKRIYFKCENLQKTGSFKARGALNSVLTLKTEQPQSTGVVTHSSGNHGQALAWAARKAGLQCTVVVPDNAPGNKCDAIRGYEADIVFCKPTAKDREETCARVAAESGKTIVPPFDHANVIAGQGTIAVEFLEQIADLEAILVPVSGGGMVSGIALAAKHIKPSIKVYAVEPEGKKLEDCLKSGERLWPNPPQYLNETIADALRVQQVGFLNFPIMLDNLEKQVFSVTNEEIVEAMKFIWQRMKLIVEPSSATGVAAILSPRFQEVCSELGHVGVILCGGNADIHNLPW